MNSFVNFLLHCSAPSLFCQNFLDSGWLFRVDGVFYASVCNFGFNFERIL